MLQYCSCLIFFGGFWTWSMWNLSSLTRDWAYTPCIGRRSSNHWTSREVLSLFSVVLVGSFLFFYIQVHWFFTVLPPLCCWAHWGFHFSSFPILKSHLVLHSIFPSLLKLFISLPRLSTFFICFKCFCNCSLKHCFDGCFYLCQRILTSLSSVLISIGCLFSFSLKFFC